MIANKSTITLHAAKLRYVDTLEPSARARYHDKIRLVGNTDPYEVEKREWSADATSWPETTYHDIINYLVIKQNAHTWEDFQDIKSLTAYNQFLSGWVKDVGCIQRNNLCLTAARVKNSQRSNETPQRPWIVAEKSGRVLVAHCDCVAGLSEACCHVGALLFSIEAGLKISKSKSVKQEKVHWPPLSGADKVPYAEIRNIDFTSTKSKKRHGDQTVPRYVDPDYQRSSQQAFPPPTDEELKQCFDRLLASGLKPAVLALDARYADLYIPTSAAENITQMMSELKDDQCFAMTKEDLMEHCPPIYEALDVTTEQISHVENITQTQAHEQLWGGAEAEAAKKRRIE